MSKTSKIALSVAALAVVVTGGLVTSCARPASDSAETNPPVELQTYTVPEQYKEELRLMLQSALGGDDKRIGRVTKGPGGTLLVVAPPRIQAGVREVLSKGFEAPPAPRPVKLTYWLLVGRPSAGERAFSVTGRAVPKQLERALGEIGNAQGPTEFALLEQLQLTAMSQERAESRGNLARITQRATRTGDQVVADVEIVLDANHVQSQVMLEPGQFLVLGQSGYSRDRDNPFPDRRPDELLTLYYVMTADLAP